jgi:hypothetical protein
VGWNEAIGAPSGTRSVTHSNDTTEPNVEGHRTLITPLTPLQQVFAWGLYHSSIRHNLFQRWLTMNIPLPVAFVFARPHMTYDMGSAILMKGGSETGNTFVGNNDFQLGDDINTKVHHGHYTYYSKAVVKREKNILVAHNVFGKGYAGGNDCSFRQSPIPDTEDTNSTFVMMVPYHERQQKTNPLNVFHASPSGDEKHTLTTAAFYGAKWAYKAALDDSSPFAPELFTPNSNDLCWQGHQMAWDGVTNNGFTVVTKNTGHWGPLVYPGCGQVRNGQMKYFEM